MQHRNSFSVVKDLLKPKRSGLGDEHFEMLAFLKELSFNNYAFVFCAVLATATAFVVIMYWYVTICSSGQLKNAVSLYMATF